MQISSLINSIHTIKQNINAQSVNRSLYAAEKADTFTRTTNPINSKPSIAIETDGEISPSFYSEISSILQSFPKKWLDLFKQNNYKIILTDDMKKIIDENNIQTGNTKHPSTTMGLTYTNSKTNQNFFCFNSQMNPKFIRNVVNHEFGHGVCNIKKLYNSPVIKSELSKDIASIIKERKLDKLTAEERQLLSNYFFNKKANMPVDEIVADLFAYSQTGGGCYGSELMLSKEHPNLMPTLFPNLYQQIKTL